MKKGADDCPHCEKLRQRILQLEEQLGERISSAELGVFMDTFNLSPLQARLFAKLFAARGGAVPKSALFSELGAANDANLKTIITQMRQANTAPLIDTVRGVGYALSPEAMKAASDALKRRPKRASSRALKGDLDALADRIVGRLMDAGVVSRRRRPRAALDPKA